MDGSQGEALLVGSSAGVPSEDGVARGSGRRVADIARDIDTRTSSAPATSSNTGMSPSNSLSTISSYQLEIGIAFSG